MRRCCTRSPGERSVADERGRGEHAERTHHQQNLHDHERRVAVDVADRAADLNGVRGDRAERQQKEHDEEDVEERLPEVVADFEPEDLAQQSSPRHQQPR